MKVKTAKEGVERVNDVLSKALSVDKEFKPSWYDEELDYNTPREVTRRWRSKYEDGTVEWEYLRCPCGSSGNDKEMIDYDRYFIPYDLVQCIDCGIMRQRNVLTDESLDYFYKEWYRKVFNGADSQPGTEERQRKMMISREFPMLVNFLGESPRDFLDVGCYTGAIIESLHQHGIKVHGCDYESWALEDARRKVGRANITAGQLKDVPEHKYHVVFYYHVLEHIKYIREELDLIREKYLADDGVLIVALPGTHNGHDNMHFNHSHIWQFSLETLRGLMESCGFQYTFGNQQIYSVWKKGEKKVNLPSKEIIDRDFDFLYPFFPNGMAKPRRIYSQCGYTIKRRLRNMEWNVQNLDALQPDEKWGGEQETLAIIAAPGPSLKEDWGKLIGARNAYPNAKVFALDKALGFLLSVGIKPDYVVSLDVSPEVLSSYADIDDELPDCEYVLCTNVDLEVGRFLRSHGKEPKGFMIPQAEIDSEGMLRKVGKDEYTMITSGGTTATAAAAVALLKGAKRLMFFGLDCIYPVDDHNSPDNYAGGKVYRGLGRDFMNITVDGKQYRTTAALISQLHYLEEVTKQVKVPVAFVGENTLPRIMQRAAEKARKAQGGLNGIGPR